MRFQAFQRDFARHIRDPRAAPRPEGVPARRMRIYNELLYANVEGFLLACFPVCRRILGRRRWGRLVRAFFRDHACRTPFFRQIPEEFLRYLQDEWQACADDPDFLPELAHYEWVELALDTSDQDESVPPHDPAGDLLEGRPLLNPVSRVLAYRYPVHRLSPRYRPTEPPPQYTFILAFRDAELRVRFLLINPLTARLLTLIGEAPGLSGRELLCRLAGELGETPDALMVHGRALLEDLRAQGALLGVRRIGSPA